MLWKMICMSAASTSKAYQAIIAGGLLAGVLDLTAALINSSLQGRRPIGVLQAIASGLLGADSFKGGFATAVLGVVLHFIIATGATAVYYAASRKLTFLVKQILVCGPAYGVAVYFFMNEIVLPLSAIPFKISYTLPGLITGLMIHMLCVGLPIAFAVRRFSQYE